MDDVTSVRVPVVTDAHREALLAVCRALSDSAQSDQLAATLDLADGLVRRQEVVRVSFDIADAAAMYLARGVIRELTMYVRDAPGTFPCEHVKAAVVQMGLLAFL